METKIANPIEKIFAGLGRPFVLSALASFTASQLKKSLVQELAEQTTDRIKEIDQTRDLLVKGVYQHFREQVQALKEGRADELEIPSAALPPGITHEGSTSMMSHPYRPLRPLGYFFPAPGSSDSEVFLDLEKEVFPGALTTHDMAALILLCVQEAIHCEQTYIKLFWRGDEASCFAWNLVSELTPEAKLRLASDLLNQMIYAGR